MNRENVDLTKGIIWKRLLSFTMPLLLSALLQQLYNTVDLLIVGRFAGEIDMAAIGAAGPIAVLVIALFIGLSTGASVLVAQYYGAKDRHALSRIVETNYAIAVFGGLVLTVLTVWLTPQFLRWISTPQNIMAPAVAYMRILFMGLMPVMVYNMGSAILRSVGDSVRPFNFLAVSAGANIALDLLFVGVFHMGAVGAGIATALAQSISGVLVTISLLETTDIYRLRIKRIRFHKDALMRTFSIGLPASISAGLISLSNVIIQSEINVFGADAIAGVAASGRIDGFLFTSLEAFALAMTTFVGQNIGARKSERLKRGIQTAMTLCLAFVAGISILLFLFREPLMAIFNGDPKVIDYGAEMIRILAPAYILFGATEVFSGAVRGSGAAIPIMIITLIGMFIVRIGWILLAMPIFQNIEVIYYSYPISWIFTFLLTLWYYYRGAWRKDLSLDLQQESQ